MAIKYFNEDVPAPKFPKGLCREWIKETILTEGKIPGELSFIFCSDNYLLEVNRKYLAHDYYTDIITFDDVVGNRINGDIFISVERVRENSVEFKSEFSDELHRIIIHGVLHLLGYKDKLKKDKTLMTEKEDYYLNQLKKINVT